MTALTLKKDFLPIWDKITPYIQDSSGDVKRHEQLLATAEKALYAYLCKVVKGLALQIKALDNEHHVKNGTQESPVRKEMGHFIRLSLAEILVHSQSAACRKAKCADLMFVTQQIKGLKAFADGLMQEKIGWEWKFWARAFSFLEPSD